MSKNYIFFSHLLLFIFVLSTYFVYMLLLYVYVNQQSVYLLIAQILRKREEELENELERLAKEKIVNQQRMTTLKKELSAQWDHINFNSLIPPESMEPSKVPG